MGGGLALVEEEGIEIYAYNMPQTEKDIADLIKDLGQHSRHCWIENVHAFPKQAVPNFKLGRNFGTCLGALAALNISHELVRPRDWQKIVGVTPKKRTESKTKFKNQIKGIAQRLFPTVKVTLKTADAILIAEACRRTHP
jgi:hypothetical protein